MRLIAVAQLTIDLAKGYWCRTSHCLPYRRRKIARVQGKRVILSETGASIEIGGPASTSIGATGSVDRSALEV